MCHGVCKFTHDSFQLALYRHKKKKLFFTKQEMDQGARNLKIGQFLFRFENKILYQSKEYFLFNQHFLSKVNNAPTIHTEVLLT